MDKNHIKLFYLLRKAVKLPTDIEDHRKIIRNVKTPLKNNLTILSYSLIPYNLKAFSV